jgi:molybdate transport system substrate-binding protein
MRVIKFLGSLFLLIGVFSAQAQAPQLTIFAAASLTDVFTEAGSQFTEMTGTEIAFNFGSSSTLATQLTEGAEADIFASANIRQAQLVMDAGLANGDMIIFAKNRLVVITPVDNPANIQTLSDLSREGVFIAIATLEVPVRGYTDQMLEAMRQDSAYGQAFFDGFYANVVIEGANVRQVVTQVALGEADAGVVYASDVTPDMAEDLVILDVPDAFNVMAEYPLVLLAESQNMPLAQDFIAFLLSDDGQDLFVRWGFISVRPQKSWGWSVICEVNPAWDGCS